MRFDVTAREGGGYALVFYDRHGDQCGMRVCASRAEAELFGEWTIRAMPKEKAEW